MNEPQHISSTLVRSKNLVFLHYHTVITIAHPFFPCMSFSSLRLVIFLRTVQCIFLSNSTAPHVSFLTTCLRPCRRLVSPVDDFTHKTRTEHTLSLYTMLETF